MSVIKKKSATKSVVTDNKGKPGSKAAKLRDRARHEPGLSAFERRMLNNEAGRLDRTD